MNGIYNNISPVINTAPQAWIDQQTLRGIGSNRSRLYVDPNGDLYGQFENNPPKKIANLGGTGSESATGVPVGAVFQWIGGVAPAGYLMCDGNHVSGLYPKLSALLATWGGKTPDLRGRFVIGASATTPAYTRDFPSPLSVNSTGGDLGATIDIEHIPEHSHDITEESGDSHTHNLDLPNHSHLLSAQTLTGHSHAIDTPGNYFTGDSVDEQDADAGVYEPLTTDVYFDNTDDAGTGGDQLETGEALANSLAYRENSYTGALEYSWGFQEKAVDTYYADTWVLAIYPSNATDVPHFDYVDGVDDSGPTDGYHTYNHSEHVHLIDAVEADHDHLVSGQHYHAMDLDLSASTADTNNGIEYVPQQASSGMTSSDGFIDSATDADFLDGDAGGGTFTTGTGTGSGHSHGGSTGSVGSAEPEPINLLPPYIAMNFIIKHD